MFDKATVIAMRNDLEKELAALGEKYGAVFKVGNAKFSDEYVNFDLQCSKISTDGVIKTKERVALEKFYPALVDKQVTVHGKSYTVVGYRTSARKNPFEVIEVSNGKKWVVSNEFVKTK